MLQTLVDHGLTEKEARIYVACLEYSALQPSTIASKLNINRVTCYDTVKSLCKKWYLSESIRNGVKRYVAVSPTALLENFTHTLDEFKTVIPDLLAIAGKFGIKPKIKWFEGLDEMKVLYQDTLQSTVPILAFVWNHVAHPDMMTYFDKHYLPRRKKKKVFAQVLLSESPANRLYHMQDSDNYRESRFLDPLHWDIQCEINIYWPNKVFIAMYNAADMCGLMIESETVYETMKTIFNSIRGSGTNE